MISVIFRIGQMTYVASIHQTCCPWNSRKFTFLAVSRLAFICQRIKRIWFPHMRKSQSCWVSVRRKWSAFVDSRHAVGRVGLRNYAFNGSVSTWMIPRLVWLVPTAFAKRWQMYGCHVGWTCVSHFFVTSSSNLWQMRAESYSIALAESIAAQPRCVHGWFFDVTSPQRTQCTACWWLDRHSVRGSFALMCYGRWRLGRWHRQV